MYDYIIIGQGIAGTILSHTLLKNNKKIFLVNNENHPSTSSVAAGIYNPITGKRMVKTWKAAAIFPFLKSFYTDLEQTLGTDFFFEMPVYKPFGSFSEQNYLISHLDTDQDFLKLSAENESYKSYIHNDFGGFETMSSGYVHVNAFLGASRKYFLDLGIYKNDVFHYHELAVKEDHVQWKNISSRRIIFCEGPKSIDNPFFSWLPFVLTKGEILEISISDFPENVIFNKTVFLLPNGSGKYIAGATYEWDFSDNHITDAGKALLESRLADLIKSRYEVIGHKAGIRPTVKDRRPIIGFHPQFKTLGVFNGLGTKGISLAPYFANHFLEHLENGKDLDPEINIERFYSLQ